MSTPINDGGSAFPQAPFLDPSGIPNVWTAYSQFDCGMTLRDYFAAKAMAALLARHAHTCPELSKWSYDLADEMIAARGKQL